MFFISFLLCGLARLSTLLLNYKHLSPYFGYQYKMLTSSIICSQQNALQAMHIKRSIRLAARYTPWNSNCLTQAIAAIIWCKYYNIPYLLFIGFAKKSQKPLGHDAHAWITTGAIAITGELCFNAYQVIYTYSNCILTRE